jgi:hypothetical protein
LIGLVRGREGIARGASKTAKGADINAVRKCDDIPSGNQPMDDLARG